MRAEQVSDETPAGRPAVPTRTVAEIIRGSALFEWMTTAERWAIARRARLLELPAETALTVEGQVPDRLFLLLDGHADLFAGGRRQGRLSAGESTPEEDVWFARRSLTSAVTATPVLVLAIEREAFWEHWPALERRSQGEERGGKSKAQPVGAAATVGGRVELLRELPQLRELPPAHLVEIAGHMRPQAAARGTALVVEGRVPAAFHLVVDGAAEASRGGERRGILVTGQATDLTDMRERRPSSVTVVALTPLFTLAMSRAEFRSLQAALEEAERGGAGEGVGRRLARIAAWVATPSGAGVHPAAPARRR